ncbi:MAG: LysM peptidoglycan-binding domain-containing protein [Chloroflexi bacterium]|nr:LysM peptidoglycan-binding domain-containing protein [Chloroflexota bacterium]MCC6891796.1 LysM peptidoglycan-binding domain-containing protein [Anaerolineae bacterium]
MRSYWNKSLVFLGSAALLLTLAGCFQSAGGDNSGFSVAQNAGPTFTPFPTDPPIVQEVIVTATPDPNAIFAEFPTQDPNTLGIAIPTTDPNGFTIPQDQQTGVVLDPLEMTATFIVQQATDTAGIQLTQTAQAIFGIPTATEAALFATATPSTGGVVGGTGTCIHTVTATDSNLYRISLNYNATPQEIATASGLANMNLIYVGQELTIPNCGTGVAATSVPSDGTGGTGGLVGQTYVVVQGDTLFKISQQFGVPVVSIANANGISNINLIVINQQLVIPPA